MELTGRRRLAGITNQNAGAIGIWGFTWYAPDGSTVINAHGLIVPLSGSLRHSADLKMLKDWHGNEVSVLATNEKVTIEVVCVPQDAYIAPSGGVTAAGSLANVIEAATFPQPNGWVTIATGTSPTDTGTNPKASSNNLVIPMGSFTDILNSTNWMYNSDGSLEYAADGEWGMRFTLTQRLNLPRTVGIAI